MVSLVKPHTNLCWAYTQRRFDIIDYEYENTEDYLNNCLLNVKPIKHTEVLYYTFFPDYLYLVDTKTKQGRFIPSSELYSLLDESKCDRLYQKKHGYINSDSLKVLWRYIKNANTRTNNC